MQSQTVEGGKSVVLQSDLNPALFLVETEATCRSYEVYEVQYFVAD